MSSQFVYFHRKKRNQGSHIPDDASLHDKIIAALRTVYDPEIPVNLYDLGLIYGIDIKDNKVVFIQMTLTAPACPVAAVLLRQVENVVAEIEQVQTVHVELVWEPPWTKEQMSDEARLELGLF